MNKNEVAEKGFSTIPNVFSSREVADFVDSLQNSSLPRSRAGIRHALRHPGVSELARGTKLSEIARGILGDKAVPFRAILFDKSPNSNWLVVWHQDTALPLRDRRDVPGWGPWSVKEGVIYAHAPGSALSNVLALRLHLDDSRIDNGPLRALPGTHQLGVLTDAAIHQLSGNIPAVDCVVSIGGVLAMRPLLVHSSSKSLEDAPRRVLHIEYAPSLCIEDGFRLAVA
jgi:ectoine hydroxylase-related dioxygenase (phytanoyl-CoA dioxygenase family)